MPDVYILQEVKNGRFYIGSTVDLEKRLKHHSAGHTPSTKRMRKQKLVFSQSYDSLAEARSIEKKLKKLKRRDYIKKIIKDGFIRINP